MSKLEITGWAKGCDTVAAIKLIREKTLMPLNEALGLVNQVLGGKEVFIQVSDSDSARLLIDSLKEIGMTAISIDDKRGNLKGRSIESDASFEASRSALP